VVQQPVAKPTYHAFWAKSGNPYHPLLTHVVDSAGVALAIVAREQRRTRGLYAEDWHLPDDEALRFVAFLVGLHDLGKASPVFQASWPEGAARVKAAGFTWDEERVGRKETWVAHGVLTELYVMDLLKGQGLARQVARTLGQCLAAHHGFQTRGAELQLADIHRKLEPPVWAEVRDALLNSLRVVLGLSCLPKVQDLRPEAALRVMGLTSFADWIASDRDLFPPGRGVDGVDSLTEALDLAEKALDSLGWRTFQPPLRMGFTEVFPHISRPNPLQEAIPRLLPRVATRDPQGGADPILLLIEAPMGTGKTEAALYAHLLLQTSLEHRGLYVALPTQATANGLFTRVGEFLGRLGAQAPLDLQLQHGAAPLNPAYVKLQEVARPDQVHDGADPEDAAVVASAWFSTRKRAMLSSHGVGTLDQALLGVLKVRHHFLRLWGLMNRTVVLDEVHAYDAYTSGLLQALLRCLRALGSSVVLMTATLASSQRKRLLQAWGAEAVAELPPYPRAVAFVGSRLLRAEHIPFKEGKDVRLSPGPVPPETLADHLRRYVPGAVGTVVNTVDRAQALYRALGLGERVTLEGLLNALGPGPSEGPWAELRRQQVEKGSITVGKRLPDGTLILLLHARFPAEERAIREGVVLSLFGKHGPRPRRAILVATQVAEQSLDLDFDLLYTDLAPIDLVVQRAGRLHRHNRERPPLHREPVLLIGGLEGDPDFGAELYWNRVYEDYVLLSSWLSLRGRARLRVPEDLEPLLEEVYERAPGDFPEALRGRATDGYRELQEARTTEEEMARNLALSDLEGLLVQTDSAALVGQFGLDDDAEDGRTQRLLTRLGDPSVPVVPVFRIGEQLFLDPQGNRPARTQGVLDRKEEVEIWNRTVRVSRYPIPQSLLREEAPRAWKRSGLLRNVRPLDLSRTFRTRRGEVRVELDPELGVIYRHG